MVMLNIIRSFCRRAESKAATGLLKVHAPDRYKHFVDSLRVYVSGGRGGTGLPRFGGMGGKGGDVYVEGHETINDLKALKDKCPEKQYKAPSGEDSRRYRILGKPGNDVIIKCPLGVQVMTDEGRVLGEVNNKGDRVLVALGGKGGDAYNQYNGMSGQKQSIRLDLKLIADVGFVGFPNAGKSTLLKAVSRAAPKIASYPFTTINPNLGIIEYSDYRRVSAADLPGLIEGAHLNMGLGHKFLKHVERTKLLLFVIDVNGFRFSPESPLRSPLQTLLLLNKELELYDEKLLDKPALLSVSKMDSRDSDKKYRLFLEGLQKVADGDFEDIELEMRPNRLMEFEDIVSISSKTSRNIARLRDRLRDVIEYQYLEDRIKDGNAPSFRQIIAKEQKTGLESELVLI